MCTELREQPALSVARVEVNYFQRRLPGASIKAAPFPTLFPFHSVPLLISICLSSSLSLPHDTRTCTHMHPHIHTHTYTHKYWRKRTCIRYRTPWILTLFSLFLIPFQSPSPPRLSTRALHECTRLPWLRRESARIARFLRESPRIVAFRMKQCATGRWSRMRKFDPARGYAREPSRAARNFAFGLTIMRHVPGKFINAPEGTARNYEWTVENNRPRRTKRSMRTVDPALHSLTLELKILFLALSPIDASKAHLDTFLTYISIDWITPRPSFR